MTEYLTRYTLAYTTGEGMLDVIVDHDDEFVCFVLRPDDGGEAQMIIMPLFKLLDAVEHITERQNVLAGETVEA